LAITGGEPYLRDDLYKIIVLARKNIQNLKIISIPSNGLDKERTLNIIKRLIKFRKIIFYLSFSIDGSEKVHNKIRGVKNAYTKTMETYEAVRLLVKPYKNFHIFLQTTISKYNSSDLYNYLDRRINKLKLQDDFVVTVFHEAPFYKNKGINNLNRVKMSDINRIIEIIKKSKKEFDPKNYIQKKYLKGLSSYIVNKENIIECMALQDSFSINNYGEMSPCLMWSMNLGNFREFGYNINKVWKSGNFNSIREKIKRHQCPGCWTPCEAYQSIISDTFFNSFIIKNILRFK
jgi:MoaA/NifB/PqqE/SkfB family radical SAM enzyme